MPGSSRLPVVGCVRESVTHSVKGATQLALWGCALLSPKMFVRKKETRISDPRINDRIRATEVRLVGPEGEQVGVVRVDIALRLAQKLTSIWWKCHQIRTHPW